MPPPFQPEAAGPFPRGGGHNQEGNTMLQVTEKAKTPQLERHLGAVEGYLFLKMAREALRELNEIPAERRDDLTVLRSRVRTLLHLGRWKQALSLAVRGLRFHEHDNELMVQRAFALHKLEKGPEAVQVILDAPEWIRRSGILHYNLACYEAQLGDLRTARQCIRVAFEMNSAFKKSARRDPDLQRLWN